MTQEIKAPLAEAKPTGEKPSRQTKKVAGADLSAASSRSELRSSRNKANFDAGSKYKDSRNPTGKFKKGSIEKSKALDTPPTPRGCEWRVTDNGWNLFRHWSDRDDLGKKIKKDRYAGYLSKEAWEVMKEYDYETFIAVIA